MAVTKQEVILVYKSDTSDVVKNVNKAKQSIDKTTDSTEVLTNQLDKMTGGAISGFKNAAQGTKSFITGLKLTRAAIIGTGIGALVVGVVALVQAFGKTEEGARRLKKAFAPIQAIIDVLQVKVSALGGAFFKLFSGDFTGAVNDFNKALGATNGEYQKQIELYDELIDREFALQDARIEQTVQTAKTRAEIKELNLVAEDLTKTTAEREAAAARAGELERNLFEERKRLAEEELAIAQARLKSSRTTTEDRENVPRLEAEIFQLAQESLELQTTLNNKLNTIRAEGIRKQEEEAAKRKAILEEEKKLQQEQLAARQKLEDDLYALGLSAQEKDELALMEAYDARIAIAGDDEGLVTAATEHFLKSLEELRKRYREAEKKEEDARLDAIIGRQAIIDEVLQAAQFNEEQAVRDKYARLAEEARKNGQILVGFEEAQQKELDAIREKYSQEELARKKAVIDAGFQLASNALTALQALNDAFSKSDEASAKKAFDRNKTLGIASAVLNTASAVLGAISPAAGGLGIPAGIPGAILAAATGAAQIATIAKTEFKSGASTTSTGSLSTPTGGGGTGVGAPTLDLGFLGAGAGQDQPIRAYVLAENVSNSQQANQKIKDQTLIG